MLRQVDPQPGHVRPVEVPHGPDQWGEPVQGNGQHRQGQERREEEEQEVGGEGPRDEAEAAAAVGHDVAAVLAVLD